MTETGGQYHRNIHLPLSILTILLPEKILTASFGKLPLLPINPASQFLASRLMGPC